MEINGNIAITAVGVLVSIFALFVSFSMYNVSKKQSETFEMEQRRAMVKDISTSICNSLIDKFKNETMKDLITLETLCNSANNNSLEAIAQSKINYEMLGEMRVDLSIILTKISIIEEKIKNA